MIVDEVARFLLTTSKSKAGQTGAPSGARQGTQRWHKDLAQIADKKDLLARSGRQWFRTDSPDLNLGSEQCHDEIRRARAEHLRNSRPTGLPQPLSDAVQKVFKSSRETTNTLPFNMDQIRTRRRAAASSTVREHLSAWLESTEGQEWKATRDAMYRADDAPEED